MAPARYAQHFLVDEKAVQKIVNALDCSPEDSVLEIGPGRGILTQPLASVTKTLTVIEIDPVLATKLRDQFKDRKSVTVVNNDILKFDFGELPGRTRPYKVIGNLPYNITSPILRRLCHWDNWQKGCVMVQKEVGDRMCASVGTGEYGALTVGMNLSCQMEKVFDLLPDSFRPRPRVDSTVVKITKRLVPLTENIDRTQRIVQAAFQQRRKTILNSMSHGLKKQKNEVKSVLDSLQIEETARPERLSPETFVKLGNAFYG